MANTLGAAAQLKNYLEKKAAHAPGFDQGTVNHVPPSRTPANGVHTNQGAEVTTSKGEHVRAGGNASLPEPESHPWRNVAIGAGVTAATGGAALGLYRLLNKRAGDPAMDAVAQARANLGNVPGDASVDMHAFFPAQEGMGAKAMDFVKGFGGNPTGWDHTHQLAGVGAAGVGAGALLAYLMKKHEEKTAAAAFPWANAAWNAAKPVVQAAPGAIAGAVGRLPGAPAVGAAFSGARDFALHHPKTVVGGLGTAAIGGLAGARAQSGIDANVGASEASAPYNNPTPPPPVASAPMPPANSPAALAGHISGVAPGVTPEATSPAGIAQHVGAPPSDPSWLEQGWNGVKDYMGGFNSINPLNWDGGHQIAGGVGAAALLYGLLADRKKNRDEE